MSNPVALVPVGNQLWDATSEWSDGSLGLDDVGAAASVGFAALDFAFNPAEAAVSNALGVFTNWLLANCDWFKEVVDQLLGSPDEIETVAADYSAVAASLAAAGNAHADAVTRNPSWTGPASTAYRERQRSINDQFRLAVTATDAVAGSIRAVGTLVGIVREFIIALIQDLLAKIIMKALLAIAAAIPSFGASIAAGTAAITFDIGVTSAKWSMKLAKLVRKVIAFCDKWGISTTKLKKIYHLLTRNAANIRRGLQGGAHLTVGQRVADGVSAAARGAHRAGSYAPGPNWPVGPGPYGAGANEGGARGQQGMDNQQNHSVRDI